MIDKTREERNSRERLNGKHIARVPIDITKWSFSCVVIAIDYISFELCCISFETAARHVYLSNYFSI